MTLDTVAGHTRHSCAASMIGPLSSAEAEAAEAEAEAAISCCGIPMVS